MRREFRPRAAGSSSQRGSVSTQSSSGRSTGSDGSPGGRRRVAFALVANGAPYTYFGRLPVHAAPMARFELGLDLVAPERLRPSRLPGLAISVLGRPRHTRARDILYLPDVG